MRDKSSEDKAQCPHSVNCSCFLVEGDVREPLLHALLIRTSPWLVRHDESMIRCLKL